MIAVGQRYTASETCHAVSLIDVSQTIVEHFGQKMPTSDLGAVPGASIATIGVKDDEPSRVVFSEYHAAGAISGAFMMPMDAGNTFIMKALARSCLIFCVTLKNLTIWRVIQHTPQTLH